MTPKIVPVIMSGGTGSRLWPMSRRSVPKQFLCLMSNRTLFQETIERVSGSIFSDPIIVGSEDHKFLIENQFIDNQIKPKEILFEPLPKNTAPALALAAFSLVKDGNPCLMLALPCDHYIGNPAEFLEIVEQTAGAAVQGQIITFGVTPTRPETGYGYIESGDKLPQFDCLNKIASFVEKPDTLKAAHFMASGSYLWNSGIFLMLPEKYLSELKYHEPEMYEACKIVHNSSTTSDNCRYFDRVDFDAITSKSIDYAVMEKTSAATVAHTPLNWSDVGTWQSLWQATEKDVDGNSLDGDIIVSRSTNILARTNEKLLVILGVSNIAVICTDDAVLVTALEDSQNVRHVVDELFSKNRLEAKVHKLVERPWGSFRSIAKGNSFQVKEISVNRGQKLSLQSHKHRAEHWVVVAGRANVTCGKSTSILTENQSIFIPKGEIHRLENTGETILKVIEVQLGSYLGEDDITRYQDIYGRI